MDRWRSVASETGIAARCRWWSRFSSVREHGNWTRRGSWKLTYNARGGTARNSRNHERASSNGTRAETASGLSAPRYLSIKFDEGAGTYPINQSTVSRRYSGNLSSLDDFQTDHRREESSACAENRGNKVCTNLLPFLPSSRFSPQRYWFRE